MLLLNKTLLRMSAGLKRWVFGIILLRLVVLFGTVRFAESVSGLLGDLFNPQMTGAAVTEAIISAALSALVMLIGQVLIGEAEYLCTAKARVLLRGRIMDKIFMLDVANVEQVGAANAVNLAANGVESMQMYYTGYLPALIYCFIAPVYMFLRLYKLSLPVAIILLVITMSILPLNNVFRGIIDKLKSKYWDGLHDLTGYYLEGLRGMTTLKLFNRDDDRTHKLRKIAYRFYDSIMDVMKLNFKSFLLTYGLMYAAIFVSVAIACTLLGGEKMDISSALLILMLSFSFFSSVRELSGATHSALTGVAVAQNVSELFDIKVEREFTENSAPVEGENGIAVKNVTFGYNERRTILSDVSMLFETGKTTAIVGPSGCGKSTVASMLLRFIDPQSGKLGFEGTAYTDMPLTELRKKIMMVPQRVSLFSGTVRDNLLIADPEAADERLWEILETVGLKSWLNKMPAGLDTDVGDSGAKLSGGQRQKMGIARALLSNAGYIIFDEATSSVDMESEQDIWRCINGLAGTHTLIIISHRLSTIRNADRIYVLEKGHVAGAGCHEELLESCELYANMVNEQNILEKMGEGVTDRAF